MRLPVQVLQARLSALADLPRLFFLSVFAYVLSIALLRPTPYLDPGIDFDFVPGAIWAGAALLAGFASRRPSLIVPAFLLACIGPHHRVAVLAAFATGVFMLVRVLWEARRDFRGFFRQAFGKMGAGYVLAIGVYLTFVWLLRLGDSTDGWSFLALGASMFAVPLGAYSLLYLDWRGEEKDTAIRNVGLCAAAVALVVLLHPLCAGAWSQYGMALYVYYKAVIPFVPLPFTLEWSDPDYNAACLRSAHYAAVLLYVLAIGTGAYAAFTRNWKWTVAAVLSFFAASMGENAHILPGVFTGAALAYFVHGARARKRPAFAAALAATVPLMIAAGSTIVIYNWNDYLNALPKARLYTAAEAQIRETPARYLIGEGPAAYASHAAAKRLAPGMLEGNIFPLVPGFTNSRYAEAINASMSPNRFTTIHRPTSGLLGLFMEWGVLGTLLLLYTISRMFLAMFRNVANDGKPRARAVFAAAFAAFSIVGVSLAFRTYAEYPDVMAAVSVLFLLASLESDGSATHSVLAVPE